MKNKFLTSIVVTLGVAVVLLGGYFLFGSRDQAFGLASTEFTKYASDIVGSRSGTSTTYVAFRTGASGGQSATSSYVAKISGEKDVAVYTFKVGNASSSANLVWDIQGTNDDYCETSTSTTVFDQVTTGEINWYSAGDHIANKAHATTFDNASSTQSFRWNNPNTVAGQEVILTNLDYQCLRLNISGSSTEAYVGLRTK